MLFFAPVSFQNWQIDGKKKAFCSFTIICATEYLSKWEIHSLFLCSVCNVKIKVLWNGWNLRNCLFVSENINCSLKMAKIKAIIFPLLIWKTIIEVLNCTYTHIKMKCGYFWVSIIALAVSNRFFFAFFILKWCTLQSFNQ